MKTILLLSAQAEGSGKLSLDQEIREIREALRRSSQRDCFKLETRSAVRWKDVRRAIDEVKPEIVQFSGHGEGKKGIVLEEEDGTARYISADALALTFELFPLVECVLLNACYSDVQAEAIHRHVPCVVGMSLSIGDRAAREFAEAFYDGLGAGKSYAEAYKWGLAGMANDVEVWTPVLLRREEEREKTQEGELTPDPTVVATGAGPLNPPSLGDFEASRKSNQREIARLERDLAAIEDRLDVVQDPVEEVRLQERKKLILKKIEGLS